MRFTWWPGTRASPRPWPKGAAWTPPEAGRCAGPRHAGEGQAAYPWPDPARRSGGPAPAGQRAADHDPADHRGHGSQGRAHPYRRVWHLRPPARLGLPAQERLPRQGEYARDEDGDGFCEVHVNTIEGFWSLLRSWLRPHRGLS